MLGLGLSSNKSVIKRLPLDIYKDNIVLGFSYYKLLSTYNGYCVRVRRSSDNMSQDFGFINNYIDYASIVAFCGTGNGYVHTWYNQFVGGNNAIQTSNNNQPQIVSNGLFKWDGIKFTSTSTSSLRIIKYDTMNILDEPASFYLNGMIESTSGAQWFLTVNTALAEDIQLGLLKYLDTVRFVKDTYQTVITGETVTQGTVFKKLWLWENKSANGFSCQPNDTKGTINVQLTSRDNVYIGARSTEVDGVAAGSLDGKIKTLIIATTKLDYSIVSNY